METEKKTDILPQCEPCSLKDKYECSRYYCKECEEYYCDQCIGSHRSQKSFKYHDVLAIQDFLPTIDHCEPCYENHHTVDPENMCEECEEYLCESCTNVHCSQKQNKGHTIKPVPMPFSCDPCSSNDKHKIATAFCLDCEEPEPLCDDCAEQHKLMKKTKNHKMSRNKFTLNLKLKIIEEEMERSVNESLGDQTQAINDQNSVKVEEPQCEPCENRGKPTPAAYFCYDCEERYCETCTKKHKTSKNTINHCIGDIPIGTNTNTCGPCKFNDRITEASHFCGTCEENLCEGCMSSHRSQKMARHHRIQAISDRIVTCAICCELGEQLPATCYCLDCESTEPLCSSCAEEHTMMKRTKGHQLSMDISIFMKEQEQDVLYKSNCENKEELELIHDNKPPHASVEEIQIKKPGTPYVTEGINKSDHVILKWDHTNQLTEDEFYQIVMKQYPDGKWKVFPIQKPCIHRLVTVDGLKAETSYIFKVRVANDITGEEGIYSAESDIITTGESPAFRIMRKSEKIEEGSVCL